MNYCLLNNLFLCETIQRGAFGVVRFAEASDHSFGLDGFESRSCVIKTIYLQRIFDKFLKEFDLDVNITTSRFDIDSYEHSSSTNKLGRFYERLMIEIFILSRLTKQFN